ncbi:MAG: sulfatase [Verrucomicrobiales bacterium]|nr:sulfatase [Verrucomicrobiales bacterium]
MNFDFSTQLKRRAFLETSSMGIGAVALAGLLGGGRSVFGAVENSVGDASKGILGEKLHVHPKVKRVIHLCMAGGQSHLESFDYKPKLAELDGQPMPESFTKGQQLAQLQKRASELKCMGPQFAFKKWGKSGQEISEMFPHIGAVADEIAIIRSMQTEQINHDPAHTFMNTGSIIPGRPSMGAWVNYGIGSEAEDLPGFVVLTSEGGGQGQPISSRQWSNGFLPSKYQGVQFHSKGDAVHYVNNPAGVTREAQREVVDAVNGLNRMLGKRRLDPEIEGRIAQYEMAFKMQASVPGLMDVSGESKETLEMYGCTPGDGSFASNCLLARRLAERGVRFIQLYHRGWDHHGGIKTNFEKTAGLVDQGTGALIRDLKNRGMLEETLIIFGGEFGRTPMAQGSGRDHHIKAFSMFLCGGGIQGGVTHGETDELGYSAMVDPVHVHDIHATMLHLLGIDHEKLRYRFQGRDFRLTDVFGHLVKPVLG